MIPLTVSMTCDVSCTSRTEVMKSVAHLGILRVDRLAHWRAREAD
jgi:hypothetical protein